jgi:putative serine protease PepD
MAAVSAAVGAVTALAASPTHSVGGTVTAAPASASQSAATPPALSVEQVAAKVVPSVVQLTITAGDSTEEGSGIILSPDGLILTNNHVVATAGSGDDGRVVTEVRFSDGRTVPFIIVGTDPTTDIAVVRAEGVSGLTPITIGSSANLRVGQSAVAVGSPLGLQGTVTSGIISALNRPVSVTGDMTNPATVLDAVQTDAPINPGNSGGPLVDMNGAVIGVNSAGATLGERDRPDAQSGSIGLGFAIPIDEAKRIADQLITTGKATHASLGVQVAPNEETAHGAEIAKVIPGGPAALAGLPAGAIVTKADNRIIDSDNALIAAVRSKAPGDKITLSYADPSGATKTTEVTLGTAEQLTV